MTNNTINKTTNRNAFLRISDLVNNPTPRVPICLCLDTSGSMGRTVGGERTGETVFSDGQTWNVVKGGTSSISELQLGIEKFYDALRKDEAARYAAEISIVTFDNKASCIEDFANLDRQGELPKLGADGNTALGEGVNLALDLLEKRKKEYRDKGVDYFQPWLVLMTDGRPNGDVNAQSQALSRVQEKVNAGKLTVIPIAVGNSADVQTLNAFSPKREAVNIQSVQFQAFFEWLSQSVTMISQAVPGDVVDVDFDAFAELSNPKCAKRGWDTL